MRWQHVSHLPQSLLDLLSHTHPLGFDPNSHPDQAYAAYIGNGLRNGFRIGFNYATQRLKARSRNHPSCFGKPGVVKEKIAAELSAGRLLGPIDPSHLASIHTSPMGLVPKPHQKDKFRLIVDPSSPSGSSVNDGISSEQCSLKYSCNS